jgi:dihydroorotate dehydrogenase
VGTANFWDPRACERLVKQLERWCLEQQIESVAGLRGGLILG